MLRQVVERKCLLMSLPAVLILAHTRVNGLRNLLTYCKGLDFKSLYVSIDGARNSEEENIQKEIQSLILDFEAHVSYKVAVKRNSINLGVAEATIRALDWFFTQEESGLILEDDLLPNSDFAFFSARALEHYRTHKNVWMISGNQFFPDHSKNLLAVWSEYPHIWGWATWSHRWLEMREAIFSSNFSRPQGVTRKVFLFWKVGAIRVQNGLVDTWDIPIAFSMRMTGKYCILPPVNLVQNSGNDEFAVHTKFDEFPLNMATTVLEGEVILPIASDQELASLLSQKLEKYVFKIQPRHAFLALYAKLSDRFMLKSLRGKLIDRLSL
jgi:hypothetical protein